MKKATDEQVDQWQQAMLVAYRETGSIVQSCERVGISHIRHKRWLHTHPDYERQINLITELRTAQGLKSRYQTGTGRPIDVVSRKSQQDRLLKSFAEVGLIALAARLSGVGAKNHYRWIRDDEQYAVRFFEIEARVKDDGTAKRNRKRSGAHTPEQRENVRQGALRRHANMTPEQKQAERARLRGLTAKIKGGTYVTSIEAKTLIKLNEVHVPYFLHYMVGDYVADIYIPSPKLDIECDGSAFHDDTTTARESERDADLASTGITVVRLSQFEIEAGDFTRLLAALAIE